MKPTAVVFDLDGTVRDTRHRHHLIDRRRPGGPDWHSYSLACDGDSPIEGVIKLAQMLSAHHHIIVVTGAQDVGRVQTAEWLDLHDFPYQDIWMRSDDERGLPNPVLKSMWMEELTLRYRVILAVEDHPEVQAVYQDKWSIPTILVCSDGVQGGSHHVNDPHGYVLSGE